MLGAFRWRPALRGGGRDRRDPVGRLHAVDVPARELRRGDQPEERGAARPDAARVGDVLPAVRDGDRDGRVPDAVPGADGAGRRRPSSSASRPARRRRVAAGRRPPPAGAGRARAGSRRGSPTHEPRRAPRHRPDAHASTLAALSRCGAEAFRAPGRAHADRRARHRRPGRRRRRRRCCCGTATASASASSSPTTSALRHVRAGRRRHPDDPVLVATCRARRAAGRRVLRAGAVLDRRHDDDGDGDRPAGGLHRARDPVARRLRADRASGASSLAGRRGGVQVLPARRVLERVLPLRRRASPTASPAARGSTASAPGIAGQSHAPTTR